MTSPTLKDLRRLVIKIGSALLIDADEGVNRDWLNYLAEDIARLRKSGHQVLIVSSGAIALGSRVLGLSAPRAKLEELQAAAAAGQAHLMHAYQEALGRFGIPVAQILLTPDDTEVRRRFLNARNTLEKLFDFDVVPVINENDTVATEEIKYGDNDRLAARVAQIVMADGLILLSDVDGLYTSDPREDSKAEHIPLVSNVSDDLLDMAGGAGSGVGSGGMSTKLQAARIATHAGCATIIASGDMERPLRALMDGGKCTLFISEGTPQSARKQWLAGVLDVCGDIRLDAGAVAALNNGKSLLPVGVVAVAGQFSRGDAVTISDANGAELGRGIAAYASDEADAIKGCQSEHISSKLGYRVRDVMIHRDDLVLFSFVGTKNFP
jgi:glutamate 5-kinase